MGRPRSEREKTRARERAREWYANPENKARRIAANKAWREANRDHSNAYHREWRRQLDPAKRRAIWVKSKYKLTDDQYDELLRHNGICDSCGQDPAKHIDHNHETSAYRGQLCPGCNWAAGYLQDDPVRAAALAAYLVRVKG